MQPLLFRFFFSRPLRILSLGIALLGGLIYFRIPGDFYWSSVHYFNNLLAQHLQTHGQVKTVDLAVHLMGKYFMAGGVAFPIWAYFWSWLIRNAGDGPVIQAPTPLTTLRLKRCEWLALGGLTTVALLLRVFPMFQSLSADEISVFDNLIKPGFLSTIVAREPIGSHPLMQILVRAFTLIFGVSEFNLRFPMLLTSVLTIPIVFFLMLSLTRSRIAAWTIATCLTFHSYHIYYASQVRGYPLVVLFAVLSFYWMVILMRAPSRKAGVILAWVNIGLLYTHLYTVYFIFVQHLMVIAMVFFQKRKPFLPSLRSSLILYLNAFLLTMVVISVLSALQIQNIMGLTFDPTAPAIPLMEHIKQVFMTFHVILAYSENRVGIWLYLMIIVITAFFRPKSFLLVLAGSLAMMFFVLVALSPLRCGYYARYMMVCLPLILIIIALITDSYWQEGKRWIALAFPAMFLFLSFGAYPMTYQPIQSYREACVFLREQAQAHIPMVTFALGRDQFHYYEPHVIPVTDKDEFFKVYDKNSEILAARVHYPGYTVDRELKQWVGAHCRQLRYFPGEFSITVWRCKNPNVT